MTAPRAVLSRFLAACMEGDWPEAVNSVQASWPDRTPPEIDDAEYLHAIMEPLRIEAFTVGAVHRVRQRPAPPSRSIVDVDFTVTSGGVKLAGRARLVRGDKRGRRADGAGRWGVVPMSVLLNLHQTQGA